MIFEDRLKLFAWRSEISWLVCRRARQIPRHTHATATSLCLLFLRQPSSAATIRFLTVLSLTTRRWSAATTKGWPPPSVRRLTNVLSSATCFTTFVTLTSVSCGPRKTSNLELPRSWAVTCCPLGRRKRVLGRSSFSQSESAFLVFRYTTTKNSLPSKAFQRAFQSAIIQCIL